MFNRSGPHSGPPPICFNCSKEGHFVVDCPEAKRNSAGGPPLGSALGQSPSNGNYSGSPASRWTNGQNMGAPAPVNNFQKAPPVVTRFAAPTYPPQYGQSPAPYGPSPTAYQHPGSMPNYAPQVPYPPQQYGSSVPPYSHSPSPQPYSAPPQNAQYGQGYHQPHFQFPPNGAPHYTGPPAQSYGPPAVQYQTPARYQTRSNSYSTTPQPQWNNSTPVSASSPFAAPPQQQSIQQQQEYNSQREYSGTPSHPTHQTPQSEYTPAVEASRQTTQTPTPVLSTYQPPQPYQPPQTPQPSQTSQTPQTLRSSPVGEAQSPSQSVAESIPSTRASTPYGRYGFSYSASGVQTALSIKSSPPTSLAHVHEPNPLALEQALRQAGEAKPKAEEGGEDGEFTEEDLLKEQFNWDFKRIFKEPTPTEHVALSQPLSYTFTVTPVPLMDPRSIVSVSRYARKDNLKEYLKPIRSQPQWHYLKEDPAFSDVKLEGKLIPLKDVREWMAERYGDERNSEAAEDIVMSDNTLEESATSRKRGRSHEHEDVNDLMQPKASLGSTEQATEQPNKRQKNERVAEDTSVLQLSGTPTPGTPTIARSGTPSFGVPDDVWAPEPGEAASAPVDPTEALLASLGVSGVPKPVEEESNSVALDDQDVIPPYGNNPQSMSPQIHASSDGTPHTNSVQDAPPQGSQGYFHGPSQNHSGYGDTQYLDSQQGGLSNGNSYGGGPPPQTNAPYTNHAMPDFNGLPSQPNANYGPPQQYNTSYNQPPQRQPSFGDNQYQQGTFPPHGQYGPPQIQYSAQPLYSAPPNSQYGSTQTQWNNAQPQGQYNGPSQGQYGPPQGQYGGPPQNQYGPPQGQYTGPPHGQWGPSQGQYAPPQGQYSNGNAPNARPLQYDNVTYTPQNFPHYTNTAQQGNPQYQQVNNQGPQPPRQDSGYVSARGSYSNGSVNVGYNAPNGSSNGESQQGQQTNLDKENVKPASNSVKEKAPSNPAPVKTVIKVDIDVKSEPGPESPLSPTSLEILGKLKEPSKPRKIIRVISGKTKSQKPAPVVAEAYSRRW